MTSVPTDDPEAGLRRPSDLKGNASGGPRTDWPEWPPEFARTPEDRSALPVLLGLAALTPRRLLELARIHRTASGCLAVVRAGKAGSDGDRTAAARSDPDAIRERLQRIDARLIAAGDIDYPTQLLDLWDPPAGIFVTGKAPPDRSEAVSVVGARNCTAAGKEMARALGRALSGAGLCVVSGAARGIDAAAHEGALQAGGRTLAVLGCGIDQAYPSSRANLLVQIAEGGSIVSEYPPGIPAEPFRFPARNRIIAAMSRALVVVEGAVGSGSMITTEHALDMGREVFAVPGAVTNPLTQVPLALIRQGATLIRDSADLLEDLGVAVSEGPRADPADGLDPSTRSVWDALTGPSLPDVLARASGMPLPEVMARLVSLELRGMVRQVGGRFERRLPAGAR